MSRRLLVTIVLLVAVGAGLIWFLSNYDRVPVRQWTGYSGDARRNPFLALQRLAERMGASAEELRSVAQFGDLPPQGVVVLPALRENLAEPDRRRLLEWVERGGHLVVEAERFELADPLFAALGIVRSRPTSPRPGPSGSGSPPSYRWPGVDKPFVSSLSPFPPLSHPQATLLLGRDGQYALVEIPRGKGRVTAVSNLHFARNPSIGSADNAALAWQILDADATTPITIFNRPQKLSLARWLLQNAWPALAGLALLIALWIARIVPRFGPVEPDPLPDRRRLLDHLRAAGRFHWSTGRAGHLAEAAREAALRRLVRSHPEFAAAGPREREHYLVEALGLAQADAHAIVAGGSARTQTDLIRAIALYQGIHERAGGS